MDHILYLCRSGGNPPSTAKKEEIVIIRQNVIRAATNYEKIPLLKTMFCVHLARIADLLLIQLPRLKRTCNKFH